VVVSGQQSARSAEHVGGLLALLPFGPSVLKPNLQEEGTKKSSQNAAYIPLEMCLMASEISQ